MNGGSFSVRVGDVGDLPAVVALERAIAVAPYWPEAVYAAIVTTQTLAVQAGATRRCLLVAEGEGGLAGFAVGKVAGVEAEGLGEIESVVVDAQARRAGVGGALCKAVVEWSRGHGAAAVELEVRAASAGAISLYSGMGFLAVGRRRGYYESPKDDAVLMRLGLINHK
jgi:ribosomal-protein-alanine N-acetyltransferase